MFSIPPASRSAWRRASARGIPWRMFRSVISSTYARNSTSSDSSHSSLWNRLPMRRLIFVAVRILRRLQQRSHRVYDPAPRLLLQGQLTPAIPRQRIRTYSASCSGFLPLPFNPALLLQAVECREKGSCFHVEGSTRHLRDPFRDSGSVHGTQIERTEDQEVERAFQEFESRFR